MLFQFEFLIIIRSFSNSKFVSSFYIVHLCVRLYLETWSCRLKN